MLFKAVRKKYKLPTHPNFSQNLDENLKINLVCPKQVGILLNKESCLNVI